VPTLEIRSLSKSYGDRRVLDDVSFDVASGSILGFVGANGAGKTTTMRIVLGVLDADGGEVRWDGRPLDATTRRRIGYMPEERGLYPKMKVGEQLTYLARLHGLDAAAAQRATAAWTERLGVAERVGDEVQKLSLGNQQRVQLAAALVHSPEILVLDEPFSGLDPVAVDVMSDVLRERARAGVPVVFSSHQLDLLERLCDRVGIIRTGRMVALDAVDRLRDAGAPRWRVVAPSAPPGWAAAVPGARVVDDGPAGTVVEVTHAGVEQDVLAAALRTGPVLELSRVRPTLTDLFRHVVAEGAATTEEARA